MVDQQIFMPIANTLYLRSSGRLSPNSNSKLTAIYEGDAADRPDSDLSQVIQKRQLLNNKDVESIAQKIRDEVAKRKQIKALKI